MKIFIITLVVACVVAAVFFIWSGWGIQARRLWAFRTDVPDFRTPFVVSDSILPPAAVQQLQDRAVFVVRQLEQDWSSFDLWMQLASLRKVAGDTAGAAVAWEFASKLNPTASLPLHNLGNLYAYELQDSTRAEAYYSRALAVGKNDISLYVSVYEFYRFIQKDDVTAKRYLDEGIANNLLNAEDLRALLQSF
mgnify:CR=1 FL=1